MNRKSAANPRSPSPRQLKLPALKDFTRTEHGGDLRKGRRKLARPVATRRPMHLVLRSARARGLWSLVRRENNTRVHAIVFATAERRGVTIHRFANAGNHLHLVVQARRRDDFQAFLRTVSGLIARAITGARKGAPKGKFWDALAFSRVLAWGRDVRRTEAYVLQNALEGFGVETGRSPQTFRGQIFGAASHRRSEPR